MNELTLSYPFLDLCMPVCPAVFCTFRRYCLLYISCKSVIMLKSADLSPLRECVADLGLRGKITQYFLKKKKSKLQNIVKILKNNHYCPVNKK